MQDVVKVGGASNDAATPTDPALRPPQRVEPRRTEGGAGEERVVPPKLSIPARSVAVVGPMNPMTSPSVGSITQASAHLCTQHRRRQAAQSWRE